MAIAPIISLRGVTKVYGEGPTAFQALKGIDLDIEAGVALDTGATDHLTNDLDRLTTHERYSGKDQVHVANGAGLKISGHSL